jgi:short subunit dehydrogenase-like uncharacterized protein
MGKQSKAFKQVLPRLIMDIDIMGLKGQVAINYIYDRSGYWLKWTRISKLIKELEQGVLVNEWQSHYTKVGFAIEHIELKNGARRILEDAFQTLEELKRLDKRTYGLELKLREDIRNSIRLVNELALGTPVIARIKKQIEDMEIAVMEKQAKLDKLTSEELKQLGR